MANQPYEETFDYAFDEDGTGGFNSNDELEVVVGKIIRPIAPSMQENFQDIPASYGGKYLGTDYQEKEIDIPITVMCETKEDFNRKIQNLSSILINSSRDKDVQYPIRFNDNPDVKYYGHFTQIPAPQFLDTNVYDFQTTLVFMLADPRGFLPQKQIKITSNNQMIVPDGNTDVKPVIHIIPHEDLYYFGYESNDSYVAVGYNVNAGDQLIDSEGNVVEIGSHQIKQVDDPCNTLATWVEAGPDTQNVDLYRGEVDGKVSSTATAITVGKDAKGQLNFGKRTKHTYTGENNIPYNFWYGPAIIHNGLPKITPYWKVNVRLHHVKKDDNRMKNHDGSHNVGNRAMGRVEAYLLDNNGDVRGRMGISDGQQGKKPVAYIQLGTSFSQQDDAGRYRTLAWTYGRADEERNSTTKHEVNIKYKKKVKVTKQSNKKSNRSLDDSNLELRKRVYHHHKNGPRSDKGKHHAHYNEVKRHPSGKSRYQNVQKNGSKKGGKKNNSGRSVAAARVKPKEEDVTEYLKMFSYDEKDTFSNFYGEFSLERCRADNGQNLWKGRITKLSTKTMLPDTSKPFNDPYILVEDKFGFNLANIAVAFGKIDIKEDFMNHIYRNDFLSLTNYEEWRTDGSQDPDDYPHIIARAGQEIVIDCETENVFINGHPADKYVSWDSSFPTIAGGVMQALHFNPTPANADIYIDYVPAIK